SKSSPRLRERWRGSSAAPHRRAAPLRRASETPRRTSSMFLLVNVGPTECLIQYRRDWSALRNIAPVTVTAEVLLRLESILSEIAQLLAVLDHAGSDASPSDRHEVKRRVLQLREGAQELFDWLGEARLEDLRH